MRQRQSFFNRRANAFAAMALMVFAGNTSVAAPDDSAELQFTTKHAPLFLAEAHNYLFACMSINGLAWSSLSTTGADNFHETAEWPTLDVDPLPGDRLLLTGRDFKMRVAKIDIETGAITIEYEWPAEGIPTQSVVQNELIYTAAGSAGVSVWQWKQPNAAPHLIGRFPFATYTREVELYSRETLLVTDTQYSGLWFLDVTDPLRPRRIRHIPVRSYCDSVATNGKRIAFTDRMYGTIVMEDADAEQPTGFAVIPVKDTSDEGPPHVQGVELNGNLLLVAEKHAGIRIFNRDEETNEWTPVFERQQETGATYDALFLGDGRIGWSFNNEVRVFEAEF